MPPQALAQTPSLGERLLDPSCYPHPVEHLHLIETHISWVLLTGRYAYKVKKPLALPFLDFSTATARRRFCHEELRVNRRLAPELYLGVEPITGSPATPRIAGPGEPFEHAVKMVQFDEAGRLDHLLERDALTLARVREAARMVARFHAGAGVAGARSSFARADRIRIECLDNLEALEACDGADAPTLSQLRAWTSSSLDGLEACFEARRRAGRVRECHGDLHLANMTLWRDRVLAFDAIEFDEQLRWIDVMSEIAFTLMDLLARGQPDLAFGFLDAYLGESGDHDGLAVLRHYLVYRSLVRAKIAALRAAQESGSAQRDARVEMGTYTALASRLAFEAPAPMLVLTHGVSGSGKSYLTERLLGPLAAVRLRSDVERARLFPSAAGRYSAGSSARTYEALAARAGRILEAGWPVIVDATCLEGRWRDLLRASAAARGAPSVILCCQAAPETLRRRVEARAADGSDPSEATPTVLEHQLASNVALSHEEQALALTVDTGGPVDPDALAGQLVSATSDGYRRQHAMVDNRTSHPARRTR